MLPVRAFPGTKKAAVAAEPAKSPAAQEPTEKPASGRVSGQLLQMINVSDWCFRLTPSIIFIQARKFGTCLNHFLKFTEYLPPVSFVIISHGLCLHADHFHHFSSSIIIFPDINSDVMMFPWYFPIFSTRTLAWREASPSRARGACGGVAKAGQKRNSSGFHGLFMGFMIFLEDYCNHV